MNGHHSQWNGSSEEYGSMNNTANHGTRQNTNPIYSGSGSVSTQEVDGLARASYSKELLPRRENEGTLWCANAV